MRIRLSLLAVTLIMGVMISSCKKDPPVTKTDEELQIEKLSKAWKVNPAANSITVDANDQSLDWSGFVLTLGDKTYSTSGSFSPEVWPASGTWAFGADVNTLVRDDGVSMSVSVTDASLQLQFDYSAAGGRLLGVEGNWIFKMVPQ